MMIYNESLLLDELLQCVHGIGFGALERKTKGPSPNKLSERTEGSGNTKDDSVVLEFCESVMVQDAARSGIDIGVGVLSLSVLLQDIRGNLGRLVHELDNRTVLQLGSSITEFLERNETRVGVPQDAMAISRYHLPTLECLPKVALDVFLRNIRADLLLHS